MCVRSLSGWFVCVYAVWWPNTITFPSISARTMNPHIRLDYFPKPYLTPYRIEFQAMHLKWMQDDFFSESLFEIIIKGKSSQHIPISYSRCSGYFSGDIWLAHRIMLSIKFTEWKITNVALLVDSVGRLARPPIKLLLWNRFVNARNKETLYNWKMAALIHRLFHWNFTFLVNNTHKDTHKNTGAISLCYISTRK